MARKNGNEVVTVVGIEAHSTHTVKIYLSDDTSGFLMACGTGKGSEENAKWRDVAFNALEATIQKAAQAIPQAQ